MPDLSETGASSADVVDPAKSAIAEDTWNDTESESSEAQSKRVRRRGDVWCLCFE